MKAFKELCKKNYLIITIIIIAIFLRALYSDDSYIFWDESIYLMGGKAIAGQQAGYTELDFRPPLLPILIAPLALLPEHYLTLSKIFMLLLNSSLILAIYFFGKQFSKKIGLLSAFFASILPYPLMSSSWVMTDGPAAILLILTLLFYLKGFKENNDKMIYFGGFFLALAILMKLPNLLLLILILPLAILNREKLSITLKSLAIALLTLSPYLILNYVYFNNPLHGILKAFGIGNVMLSIVGAQPATMILKVFLDFFGIPLSILMFAGVFMFIKKEILQKKSAKPKQENILLTYSFFIFIPYYIYTVHEGGTPIWWDTQRFLLSFLPFGLIFSVYLLGKLLESIPKKVRWVVLALLISLAVFGWSQQYMRFSQPAISYEDGLRQVTKEMGLYLKHEGAKNLLCLGNCPPIAYYSDKKLSIVYETKDFKLKPGEQGIIFSDNIGKIDHSYEKAKTFCREKWCAYLLKKRLTLTNLENS